MADIVEATVQTEIQAPIPKGGSKVKPGKPQPGDNPNKARAQGRKNYGIKRRNVIDATDGEFVTKYAFAEPVTFSSEPRIGGGLTVTEEVEYAGKVDIRPMALIDMASPFAQATRDYGIEIDQVRLTSAANGIVANSLFAGVKSIFSSASDAVQSDATRFKGVYYYKSKLPEQLTPVVTIYGDFQSHIGKIGVKHAPQRIRQMTLAGIRITEDGADENASRALLTDSMSVVYECADWRDFVKEMATPQYLTHLNTPYQVRIAEADVHVRIPLREADQDIDAFRARVMAIIGNAAQATLISELSELVDRQPSYAWFSSPDRAVTRAGVGLRIPTAQERDTPLMQRFAVVERTIESSKLPYLQKLWTLAETTPAKHGFAAQTVIGPGTPDQSDRKATAKMPMSDADFTIGYMFHPAKDVELSPDYDIMGVLPRGRAQTAFMEESRRTRNA